MASVSVLQTLRPSGFWTENSEMSFCCVIMFGVLLSLLSNRIQ